MYLDLLNFDIIALAVAFYGVAAFAATGLSIFYMDNYIIDKEEWWRKVGWKLHIAAIIPLVNIALAVLLIYRIILAEQGYLWGCDK